MRKSTRKLMNLTPEELRVRIWIMLHAGSSFRKKWTRGRSLRGVLKSLDQKDRRIAWKHNWDRGCLKFNPNTGRLAVASR
jgi:hypothetical protein